MAMPTQRFHVLIRYLSHSLFLFLMIPLTCSALVACNTYFGVSRTGENLYLAGSTSYLFFGKSWVKKCVEHPGTGGHPTLWCNELGIHVTAQVLRRSFNTLMVTAGVNPITLRAVMGHNSKKMTDLYSGVPLKVKQDAILTAFRS